eukprot:scaffold64469_cov16-Prasinocladus_malaysianus.AAC.2
MAYYRYGVDTMNSFFVSIGAYDNLVVLRQQLDNMDLPNTVAREQCLQQLVQDDMIDITRILCTSWACEGA